MTDLFSRIRSSILMFLKNIKKANGNFSVRYVIKNLHKTRASQMALFGFVVVFILSLIVQTGLKAAPDLSDMWDLNNPADYNYDSGIEMVSGSARLKAQNYETDVNTSALYHFDESGGATVTDSTGQNGGSLIGGTFSTGNLNNAVNLNGSTDYITASSSSSLQLNSQHTIEGWTKFNSSFSANSQDKRNSIVDKGDYQLYYDNETGKVTYELANSNGQSWDAVGGGWNLASKRSVSSSVVSGTNVFVGLGNATGDAEVWRWNGTAWAKIGGDSINSSWADQAFEEVNSLASDGTNIYAGLGNSTSDGEVWRWNGTAWSKIGGDSLNGSWGIGVYESIPALHYYNSNLYAGLGTGANDAEVWRWNGTAWSKIGGDSLSSGWTTNFDAVYSFADDGTNLYAGIGNSTTDAEVWRWNGTAWSKIGGDGANGSWNTNYESVRSLKYQSGILYAGIGDGTNDAEVWRWNGTNWTQIGGDGLSSSWNTNYEAVYSMAGDGTNIFVGLGNGDGDGEVWRWNGTAWSKIGGDDPVGSWASGSGDIVMSLSSGVGGTIYAGLYDTAGAGYLYSWNGSSWTAMGGQHINNSWGYYGFSSVEVMQQVGDYLYAGLGNTAGTAQLWRTNGTNGWEMVGGQSFRGSWANNTYEYISSISSFGNDIVVGLGSGGNDAEVWRWNGTNWSQIGGDSLNSGWGINYEEVTILINYGGNLYAGLGNSSGDAEVWRWNGTAWSKIGGDSVTDWNAGYERVRSAAVLNGQLYVGLGSGTNEAEVWRWNGTAWTKVGGDGVGSSWNTSYEQVESMVAYDNKIFVGLGNSTDDAEVWQYDGTTWTKIAGDGVYNSWIAGTYETVRSLTAYAGDLYAGIGNSSGDAEVWRFSNGSWSKIGGSLNGSWGSSIEDIRSLTSFKGSLYAGTGTNANADAGVWKFGDNGYLQSATNSFDNNWHHIAATYNGSTMKIYIDGILNASVNKTLSVATSGKDLLIGSGYGGLAYGSQVPRFEGKLDEIRLSNIARTGFTTTPFSSSEQTISPKNSVRKNGVWHWDTISNTANLNGGTVNYRLSADDGVSWLYWDGVGWTESDNLTKVNTVAEITNNFDTFPVTYDGMRWQAVLKGNGAQQVALDGVNAQATSDSGLPSNPATITANKANGGGALTENSWTNGSSPYFSWTAGSDSQSGIKGYCLYLGTDNTANPITSKGILGTSPANTGGNCQFMVESNNLDLGVPGMLGSPLLTSNNNYYLSVRSIDIAGNVSNVSRQFSFRFDNTPPTNPSYINAPSGFVNTKEITMTWPSSGTGAPEDVNSGLAGLQYRIGLSGTWYGDSHSGTGDMTDLLANDGSYMTVDPPDYANLIEGVNLVYFRSWDQAGNVTTGYTTASLKINTNGAPTEPNGLTATPSSNTVNAFAFSWTPPSSYVGDVSKITYCYTVNTLPSDSNCSYTPAGITSLGSGPYATQPGSNTLYVVAKDESGNKNFANYASVTFSANTPSPGIPLNSDLVDVSIKSTNNWRLALTWDQPSSVGAGISNYRVYRSINGTTFTQVGTSSSTTYIDAGLTQQTYYYKIAACDSTNNCGAAGTVVNGFPTGKFTSPASLTSGPTVSGITTKKAQISWATDRGSDSKVAIGTSSGKYGSSEIGNSAQVTSHDISLDNLSPGTTYYFVVKWTDEDGNTATSTERSFITAPAPVVKEITASAISLSGATIEFTTKGSTKASVYYGTSESFGGLKTINTSAQESSYQVRLDGLSDGTKYYYMISTFDEEGSEYKGNVASLNTPPRPRITNLRFQPIDGEPTSTQKVSWDTNVPSTTQVVYGVVGGQSLEEQDSKVVTSHEITIKNLKDDSQYELIAQSRDSAGNLASSDRQVFKTALDTRPPKVSDIVIEPSIRGTGSEARGQIVVSWRTDEPSSSQVAYTEGSGAVSFNSKTAEDTRMTTEHLVIISDLPTSRVFSVQPLSKDKSNNEAAGEADTAIIGRASDSVLTIVFNTLRSIFGL
jgi:hypothetical protein